MTKAARKEFGDFQTPAGLAAAVCSILRERFGEFDAVIEPTCGVGAFLLAAGDSFPSARIAGLEINPAHLDEAASLIESAGLSGRVSLAQQDFFTADWPATLAKNPGRILLLGNPPWVTNAGLSAINGCNLPLKANIHGHAGLAAKTGKANFDISEWMLIHLIEAAESRNAVLAMLCKTATARKTLLRFWKNSARIAKASLHRIDAAMHFGASVDACLLVVELGEKGAPEGRLFDDFSSKGPGRRFGMRGKDIVADLDAYEKMRHLEGKSPLRWRSGLKHDCSAVMELVAAGGGRYCNQIGQSARLEPATVFPLLKCTAVFHGRIIPERWVLVPQKKIGESCRHLEASAPGSWEYLNSHLEKLAARKSSIYRNNDPFSIFGIGEYSFKPWKVAVSGLHRPPRFQVVPPFEGNPVMLDDTCYFLPFDTETEARLAAQVLNSKPCQDFLSTLMLPEAKRPITVELLQRLDLEALAREAGLIEAWKQIIKSRPRDAMPMEDQMELAFQK